MDGADRKSQKSGNLRWQKCEKRKADWAGAGTQKRVFGSIYEGAAIQGWPGALHSRIDETDRSKYREILHILRNMKTTILKSKNLTDCPKS